MSEKINCERDGYAPSYDAALSRGIPKSTFIYRARKLGVRYKIGTRIWDGYTWNVEDLNRLMPTNLVVNLRSATPPNEQRERCMKEKQTRCVHCNSPEGLHHPKTKQCPDPLGWRSLTFTPRLMARNAMTGEMCELDQGGVDTSAQDAEDRSKEESRARLIQRSRDLRNEITQIFDDAAHWNRSVRKPNEEPIDPDPDGKLSLIRANIDRMLRNDEGAS